MGNALHPNERTLIYMLRKILVALGKTIVSLILIALLAIFVTSVSPVYDFSEAKPFSGPDIFNPYRGGGIRHMLETSQFSYAYARKGHPERRPKPMKPTGNSDMTS